MFLVCTSWQVDEYTPNFDIHQFPFLSIRPNICLIITFDALLPIGLVTASTYSITSEEEKKWNESGKKQKVNNKKNDEPFMSNEFQYRFIYKKWRSSMECMNNNAFKIRCKNCVKDRLSLDFSVKLTDSNCTNSHFSVNSIHWTQWTIFYGFVAMHI